MANQTYAALKKQRDALEKLLERTKQKEQRGIIKRMQEAIRFYGLSATDLGFKDLGHTLKLNGKTAPAKAAPAKAAALPAGTKRVTGTNSMKGIPKPIRYRHGSDTWSGAGHNPRWLTALIEQGHDREEFRVQAKSKPTKKAKAAKPTSKRPTIRSAVVPGAIYRSSKGIEWDGTGDVPAWLQFQIHKVGKKLEDFRVKAPKRAKAPALVQAQPQPDLAQAA